MNGHAAGKVSHQEKIAQEPNKDHEKLVPRKDQFPSNPLICIFPADSFEFCGVFDVCRPFLRCGNVQITHVLKYAMRMQIHIRDDFIKGVFLSEKTDVHTKRTLL